MNIVKEVNPHFEDFIFDWGSKIYLLVGGYGSSKSYHAALKVILKLLEEKRTCLVVREVFGTIRDSCYSLLKEIVEDMGLFEQVHFVGAPSQVRFSNGSLIIFKGMDKPAKLKSINNVSMVWVEECSELKYAGFEELLGRLRHPSLPLYMILTTNPIARSNWTYKHFFQKRNVSDDDLYEKRILRVGNTYYHHSVASDNLFLPASYIAQLDEMKNYDPDLYRIARLGRFGVNGLLVLPQFEIKSHDDVMEAVDRLPHSSYRVGMDFGFEESYNAVVRMAIDKENKWLYLYWEYYQNHMTDDETADALHEFVETRERIKADSAEPKAIRYYQKRGFNMVATHKSNGGSRHSRLDNTRKVKRFRRIICSDRCRHCIAELKELTYAKDRDNEIIPDEFNIDPHTFSAIWYGLDDYDVADIKHHFRKEDFGL